jgi:hypothetical protein
MVKTKNRLIRIEAPHFVAGIECNDENVVCRAAPIVAYMKWWNLNRVVMYCTQKGWMFAMVDKKENKL